MPIAHAAIGNGLLKSRKSAREAGRKRLLEELGREILSGHDRVFFSPLTIAEAELDELAAFVAASSLSAAWGQAALTAIAADRSPLRAVDAIVPNVERTVATEVARAFNDERERLLVDMAEFLGGGDRSGKPDLPRPGAFKVWSAVLDSKTCSRCFAVDGEIVELHKQFSVGSPPPLHPRCRCIVESIIVHKPERLEDIQIDYGLFKEELRDVIREGRAISDRRAFAFASDSLGKERSPKVLTKRFYEESYATARSPRGGGDPKERREAAKRA